jgi:type IV pilus assembly protein PilA
MSLEKGFTLIELMIVTAIIGIMATFAIPSYQDYVVRAQVAEGLLLVQELKPKVKEYYQSTYSFPATNTDAAIPEKEYLLGNYVEGIELRDGAFHITYGHHVSSYLDGKVLTIRPAVVTGSPTSPYVWVCGGFEPVPGMEAVGENATTIQPKHLPKACR